MPMPFAAPLLMDLRFGNDVFSVFVDDGRGYENKQVRRLIGFGGMREETAEERDVAQEGDLVDFVGFTVFDHAAKDDGFAAVDGDGGCDGLFMCARQEDVRIDRGSHFVLRDGLGRGIIFPLDEIDDFRLETEQDGAVVRADAWDDVERDAEGETGIVRRTESL